MIVFEILITAAIVAIPFAITWEVIEALRAK